VLGESGLERRARCPGLPLVIAVLDTRALPSAASALSELTERDQLVLRLVAEGLSPREIAHRVDLSEDALYRFVAWVLDELAPAPEGETMRHVHSRHGSRPATAGELEEFERRYGSSLPPDDEG